ncbi:MAG: bestrophin family protein [Pirellulales bacterium]
MIHRWLSLIFWSHRLQAVRKVWLMMPLVMLYSWGVTALELSVLDGHLPKQSNLAATLGAVLGLLLVFRTNTAYDRWWEGRKLWGQLVNDSRNLAIKSRIFAAENLADMQEFGRLITSFAFELKDHLRAPLAPPPDSAGAAPAASSLHVPMSVASRIVSRIMLWKRDARIDGFETLMLDSHARSLMDICGACERIRKTPIARGYLVFIRKCIMVYLVALPWGIVHDFGWLTVVVTAIVAYFMIGLELVAEDVEEPFGHGSDDLHLDEYCRTIRSSVEEVMNAPL